MTQETEGFKEERPGDDLLHLCRFMKFCAAVIAMFFITFFAVKRRDRFVAVLALLAHLGLSLSLSFFSDKQKKEGTKAQTRSKVLKKKEKKVINQDKQRGSTHKVEKGRSFL